MKTNKKLTEIQLLKIKALQEKIFKLDSKLEILKQKHKEKEDEIIIKASGFFQEIELIKKGIK